MGDLTKPRLKVVASESRREQQNPEQGTLAGGAERCLG